MRYMHAMTRAKNHEIFRPHSYIIYTDLCFLRSTNNLKRMIKKGAFLIFLKSGIFVNVKTTSHNFFGGCLVIMSKICNRFGYLTLEIALYIWLR